jgi:hypothetical protein
MCDRGKAKMTLQDREAKYDQFLRKAPEGCEKLNCKGCQLHMRCPRQDNALENNEMLLPKDILNKKK